MLITVSVGSLASVFGNGCMNNMIQRLLVSYAFD
jgi:hypothetical protein